MLAEQVLGMEMWTTVEPDDIGQIADNRCTRKRNAFAHVIEVFKENAYFITFIGFYYNIIYFTKSNTVIQGSTIFTYIHAQIIKI